VFLLFVVRFVEYLASMCLFSVASENEVDENAVDYCLVLDQATLKLKQDLVLLLVLALGAEDALHTCFDEAIERLLELGVRIGPLELVEIQVSPLAIEMEAIDAVVF